MKIHYLASSTLISDSANSVHVTKISEAFAQLNHDITLHANIGTGKDEDIYQYYGIESSDNLNILRHNESDLKTNKLLASIKKITTRLPLGAPASILYGRLELKKHIPADTNLIMARNLYWLYGLGGKLPFIYESHSPPSNAIQKHIEKSLYSKSNCKGIVVISDKLKEIYLDIFPEIKGKIIVAHDAANDPGEQNVQIEKTLKRPFKNIGYVGHLYKGRGIEVITSAAQALPNLNFHVVGGRRDLIEDIKKSGIPNNIIFHGHLPPEQLPNHYKQFDAVLAPYQKKVAVHGNAGDTSAFMSPLKIFEYMSWGLPILCSDMPVLREVLHDRKNALMLPPEDHKSWISALKELQQKETLRKILSHNARKDFLKTYTWKTRVEHILRKAGF